MNNKLRPSWSLPLQIARSDGHAMPPGTILLEDVRKRYQRGDMQLHRSLTRWMRGAPATDAFWALRGISATIRPGETVGLVGPNAAGKSTLLKIIAGITAPTSGSVHAHGRFGSLIELGAGFHPELSGRENIMLLGGLLGLTRTELTERLPAITEFADIGPFLDTPVKRYSSGMNARLGFAIAVSVEPDILLIDEVLTVGDAAFQEKCLRRIREFSAAGVTIVLVSHVPQFIQWTCARAIWIEEGRVRRDSETSAVLHAYSEVHGQIPAASYAPQIIERM